jgi:hypothetical protein
VSDFLTNLAARTLAAPTLRPRTRMRYEPDGGDAPPSPIVPEARPHETSDTREVGAPMQSPHVQPTVAEPVRAPRQATPLEPIADTEVPLPRPAPTRDWPARSGPTDARPHATPASETPTLPDPVPAIRDLREPMRARDPPPAQPDILGAEERGVAAKRDVEFTELPIARQIAVAASPTKEEPLRDKRHRYDQVPLLAPDEASGRQGPPPIIETREPVARRSPAPARTLRAHTRMETDSVAAPQEPVVHVSIGRIEVRAVTPPAATAPAPRRSPIMTIEEYVAKRKGRP